jgi:hypothetical protein
MAMRGRVGLTTGLARFQPARHLIVVLFWLMLVPASSAGKQADVHLFSEM